MALSETTKAGIVRRFDASRDDRAKTIFNALQGRMSGEDGRRALLIKEGFPADEAAAIAAGNETVIAALDRERFCKAKEFIPRSDYAPINFLQLGCDVSRVVGRLVDGNGAADGTAFMISKRLLMTASHAIATPEVAAARFVQFDYEMKPDGTPRTATMNALAPEVFFHTNTSDSLDYTIVALSDPLASDVAPCALPSMTRRHRVESYVNIIQHPFGGRKRVVVRENRVLCVPGDFLYYMADTDEGSSGSPVFNDNWQLVGIHRYGTSRRALELPSKMLYPDAVGEGVSIKVIVEDLNANVLPNLDEGRQALLLEALGS